MAETKSIYRVNVSKTGEQADQEADFRLAVSPDGTKIAFASEADNLVDGGLDNEQILVKDLLTGEVTVVSTSATGVQGNGVVVGQPVFSPDGTKIAFISASRNFGDSPVDFVSNIYIKDLNTGAIEVVDVALGGASPDEGGLEIGSFSPDGTKISFSTQANNIVEGDTNTTEFLGFELQAHDVFVKDLVTGEIQRVSVTASEEQADDLSVGGTFSPDGTKIAFFSKASNLVEGDTNGAEDVFIKDLVTGDVERISVSASGEQGNGSSVRGEFSPDGTKFIFSSEADNLVEGDTNGAEDVFIKDLITGDVQRISVSASGEQGNGDSFSAQFSPDGSKVAFASYADNLVDGDTNGQQEIFIKDLVTGDVQRVGLSEAGAQANGFISDFKFLPDGDGYVFISDADNLVEGDTNGVQDIFLVSPNTVTGSSGDDTLLPTIGSEILTGGFGRDTFRGTPLAFDGDTITDFDGDDLIVFEGVTFALSDIAPSLGSLVLDIDTDQDGSVDTILILEGDFFLHQELLIDHADGNTTLQLGSSLTESEEFIVNTQTENSQFDSSVASFADGSFVITWTSAGQDGDRNGIFGQRFNADGTPDGDEFQVNSYTVSHQEHSSVTALSDGGFVVTWESANQDGGAGGIFGQRFHADGTTDDGEFQVNSNGHLFNQEFPSVSALTDGGFIVTWQSSGQDGSGWGVYGQRYNADGSPEGVEFRVNTVTQNNQALTSVAGLSDGGFVVSWTSNLQDGSGAGIYAQRYSASGSKTGGEFRVNDYVIDAQYEPSVGALSDGGFVVVWHSQGQDGNDLGVYGQRYNADGSPEEGEFRVNSSTLGEQADPSVTGLSDGGFIVTWTTGNSNTDIYGQRYSSDGMPVGEEFQIDSYIFGSKGTSSVAALPNGGFVVAWDSVNSTTSQTQDGSGVGIIAKMFTGSSTDIFLNFDGLAFESYSGSQDVNGTIGLIEDGAGVELQGNTWKKVALDYTVTKNTVLTFEYKSTQEGELQGIGLESDDDFSTGARTYQVFGSQDHESFNSNSTYTDVGNWQSFTINVGQYQTGDIDWLTFVNDDDRSPQNANSFFKNITFYEVDAPINAVPPIQSMQFDINDLSSFSSQDIAPSSVFVENTRIELNGNSWKRVDLDYEISEFTVLEFDFSSSLQGELHGIGLDTDNYYGTEQFIQIYGSDSWGQDGPDYDGTGVQSFSIKLADFYAAGITYDHLVLVNDDDASASANSVFDNIRLYELGTESDDSMTGTSGSQVFVGLGGDDTIMAGAGDDLLYGGSGLDDLYGQAGEDTFIFEALSAFTAVDVVHDFSFAENDHLDISDILIGYDPTSSDVLAEFIDITDDGTDTFISVDAAGGGDNFVQIATLLNVTGLTDVDGLEASGHLITV